MTLNPIIDFHASRIYMVSMNSSREANIVGALALALADDIMQSTEHHAHEVGSAAAALTLVGHEPGLSINDLRAGIGLSHPGAVRLVDRLAAAGMVSRRPATDDRRAVALTLTPKGKTACQSIAAARQDALARGMAILNPHERTVFAALAAKMLQGLVRDEDHASSVCRLCDFDRCTRCPVDAQLTSRAASA